MFILKRSSRIYGDECCDYNVIFDKQYTLEEFINSVLSNKREWGYIGIYDAKTFRGNPYIEYRDGKIINGAFPREYYNKTIKQSTASGGWSRMDYVLQLI